MLTLGKQIQSSTPSASKCFIFQISLKLCGFFMFLSGFSRSRNSFSRSPTFNKHVRFTLFASSGSHRHTSLQNPLPEATAIIFHSLHRSAGRQQPLDHAVVAFVCCTVQRRGASERPHGWLKLKVQRCMVKCFFRSETTPKRWKNGLCYSFTHLFLHWPTES